MITEFKYKILESQVSKLNNIITKQFVTYNNKLFQLEEKIKVLEQTIKNENC